MTYHRYVLAPSGGEALHGTYNRVHLVWMNDDGTSLFRVECDDGNWPALNADSSLIVMPSLDAPANRLTAAVAAHFSDQRIKAEPGDTLLNMLRKLRNAKGLSHIMIDKPH